MKKFTCATTKGMKSISIIFIVFRLGNIRVVELRKTFQLNNICRLLGILSLSVRLSRHFPALCTPPLPLANHPAALSHLFLGVPPTFSHFSNFRAMCVRVFSACVPVCECVCLFFRHIAAIECKQKDNNNNGTADMGAGEGSPKCVEGNSTI